MKQGIHPEYVECTVKCSCGNTFTTRSTKSELKVDICNVCHPFYTGQQRFVDTGGRVQRFADKFGSAKEQVAAREAAKKAERAAKAAEIEATKKADCKVVYAKSFYAGAANANTKLAGEIIGILAAPNPAEAKAGLEACVDMIENVCHFVSANDDDSICYYAHCISRTGSYLSEGCGIAEGEAIAYLIAPPLEAMYGVDAALKAADVRMCVLYAPPSETNFGGALLTGSQSACKSACDAFAAAVESVADQPKV